jgi:hypothetical protein
VKLKDLALAGSFFDLQKNMYICKKEEKRGKNMKMKNVIVVSSILLWVSCGTEEVAGVKDLIPEYQSCEEIQGQQACAEGAGDDIGFRAICEQNGTHKEGQCSTEDVVLECENIDVKGLKGDVFLYQENQVSILKNLGAGDACTGLVNLLTNLITEE